MINPFDPWADVRASAALEAIEKSRNHDGSSVITITAMEFLVIKDDARIIEADANALLAVVKVTQIELGMSVPELLMNVAKRIQSGDGDVELSDILAMWLRRLADEIKKTLDALPEHLKG